MALYRISSKDKILKTALNLFTQKGIKSTTTKELAKKAGIAEGTIYRHFKSKQQLAHFIFKYYMQLFRERLIEDTAYIKEPHKRMKAMINAFFDFSKNEPKAAYYIVIAHYTELDILKKEKFKFRNVFADVIEDGIKKKRVYENR